jgi:hypothetical protein
LAVEKDDADEVDSKAVSFMLLGKLMPQRAAVARKCSTLLRTLSVSWTMASTSIALEAGESVGTAAFLDWVTR